MQSIKKIVLIVALGASVGLAGCQSAADLTTQVSAIEAEVKADASLACGFIPTVATIASFIPGAGTAVASAATIAQAICTAVASAPAPTKSAARRRSLAMGGRNGPAVNLGNVVMPNGQVVTISGQFVQ